MASETCIWQLLKYVVASLVACQEKVSVNIFKLKQLEDQRVQMMPECMLRLWCGQFVVGVD